MIRRATAEDYPAIVAMSGLFWQVMPYSEPHDDDHVMVMVKLAQDQGLLFVLDIDCRVQGFIAGIKSPLLGSLEAHQVTEIAYWINPDSRGRYGMALIDALEKGAEAVGAKYINMIAMASSRPEVAEAIYTRRKYWKLETVYTKQIGE